MPSILGFVNKTALAWSKDRLDTCQDEWDIAIRAQTTFVSHLSSSILPTKENWKLRGKGFVHLVVDSLYLIAREICRVFLCVFRILHAIGFTIFGIGSKNYKERLKNVWEAFVCTVLRMTFSFAVQFVFHALGCLAQTISPIDGINLRNKFLALDYDGDYYDIKRDLGRGRAIAIFPKSARDKYPSDLTCFNSGRFSRIH